MEMDKRNKNQVESPLKVLWVLLSVLGLLIIVGTAGFRFFSPDRSTGEPKPVLAATTALPAETPEEFDPIEWARKSEEYPEMQEESVQDDSFIVELITEEEAAAQAEPAPEPEPVVLPVVTPEPEKPAEPEVRYKEVSVEVYWIQVGSYGSMTKAESVTAFLKDKGVSSTVQVKSVDGTARYRVRIGAFNTKAEADKFNVQVRSLEGFEESFVVQSTISRQVPVSS